MYFSLCVILFCVLILSDTKVKKNTFLCQDKKYFLLRVFASLPTFQAFVYFELTFVSGLRWRSEVISPPEQLLVPAPFAYKVPALSTGLQSSFCHTPKCCVCVGLFRGSVSWSSGCFVCLCTKVMLFYLFQLYV